MSRDGKRGRETGEPERGSIKRHRGEKQNTSGSRRSPRPVRSPSCRRCTEAIRKVKSRCQEQNFLYIDIPVDILYKPTPRILKYLPFREKEERKKKVRENKDKVTEEFLGKVCGLRNSSGGVLLVHLGGLSRRDRYPGTFDEFADDLLIRLIDDGTLFVDCFKKQWLDEKTDLSRYHDFIVLTVSARTRRIATANFMTKVPFDCKIEEPSACTVVSLFRSRKRFKDTKTHIRGKNGSFKHLHECRKIQLKAFKPEDRESVTRSVHSLAEYIWTDLRLREYITGFSKLDKGGSYFLGVSEENEYFGDNTYMSKKLVHGGISLDENTRERLKTYLLNKLESDLLLCNYDGKIQSIDPSKLIDIAYHRVSNRKYVLEVAVTAVEGLLFYGTVGPKSYTVVDGDITTVPFGEWFNHFMVQD